MLLGTKNFKKFHVQEKEKRHESDNIRAWKNKCIQKKYV